MVRLSLPVAPLMSFLFTASPARLFWLFALTHMLVWTVVSTLCSPNAPLDVIEGYAWGREWVLGTYKHPPLQAWILEIFAFVTERAAWAHFLASQMSILIAFWAVWQTGRRILSEKEALIGALLLEGVVYYTFTSPEFNPNVLQLPFWALIGLFFHRAFQENKILDWMLLGLWSAAGLYTKYSTGLLLLALAVFALAHPLSRQRFQTKGPYLSLLVCLLLFVPHFVWLAQHHFIALNYAANRMQEMGNGVPTVSFSFLKFGWAQLGALSPLIILLWVLQGFKRPAAEGAVCRSFDGGFLTVVTFAPFLVTFSLAALGGYKAHDMWGASFWNFAGLWGLFYLRPLLTPPALRRFGWAWGGVSVLMLGVYIGMTSLAPYVSAKHHLRVHFPGQALADQISAAWEAKTHTPLSYVVGDTWVAGNVAYYAPSRPHVFILGDPVISPWIDLEAFHHAGGIAVWCIQGCSAKRDKGEAPPSFVQDSFPQPLMQQPVSLARQTGADVPPVIIGWAMILAGD